jgi:hypothetical protein
MTMRQTRLARMYEPSLWAPRIGPKPLLMIVPTKDAIIVRPLVLHDVAPPFSLSIGRRRQLITWGLRHEV